MFLSGVIFGDGANDEAMDIVGTVLLFEFH